MDKELILNEIKKYYKIKTNAEFARFLGITTQNMYTWVKRKTYDTPTILAKCPEISSDWLLTGSGEMLRNSDTKKEITTDSVNLSADLFLEQQQLIRSQQETINRQSKIIEALTCK